MRVNLVESPQGGDAPTVPAILIAKCLHHLTELQQPEGAILAAVDAHQIGRLRMDRCGRRGGVRVV